MSDSVVLFAVVAFGWLLAAFPLLLLVRGVKRGVWNGRGIDVYRSERPSAFWFGIAMYGAIAAIILAVPVYIISVTLAGE